MQYSIGMHTQIAGYLKSVGMTDTESVLYVAGLPEGMCSVQTFAKITSISRTTIYSALATLEQKGLVSKSSKNGKSFYKMSSPDVIGQRLSEQINELQDRKDNFTEIVPLFDRLLDTQGDSVAATNFQGAQGVKTVVDMALFCVSRKWKIIAPAHNFFSEADGQYGKYFMKVRKQRGITAHSLWERPFLKKRHFTQEVLEIRNPRILPASFTGKFQSTIILFDDKVAFINSAKSQSAILIESKEVYETVEVLFDGLYTSSRPVVRK